jgi:hypothetical protein
LGATFRVAAVLTESLVVAFAGRAAGLLFPAFRGMFAQFAGLPGISRRR